MSQFKETIIIAMGGSLLVPDKIDIPFIKKLKDLVKYFTDDGYQIILVAGGGKTCRNYQAAAKEFQNVNDEDLDWIGIKSIWLNGEFLLRVFSDLDIHTEVVLKPSDIKDVDNALVIVGAWQPGHSSDTDAVIMAEILKAKRIINFSNTTHVFSEDPRVNTNAERFETLSWLAYRDIIPKEWTPGMSAPFDPVASQMAEKLEITVAILGTSIENLKNYLEGKEFEGTTIS